MELRKRPNTFSFQVCILDKTIVGRGAEGDGDRIQIFHSNTTRPQDLFCDIHLWGNRQSYLLEEVLFRSLTFMTQRSRWVGREDFYKPFGSVSFVFGFLSFSEYASRTFIYYEKIMHQEPLVSAGRKLYLCQLRLWKSFGIHVLHRTITVWILNVSQRPM